MKKLKQSIFIFLIGWLSISASASPCNFEVTIEKANVKCHGEATGAATAIVTGDTGPYTYRWSTGAITKSISNLPAETYFVKVTDKTGCEIIEFIQINQPDKMHLTSTVDHVKCHAEKSGRIEVKLTGGMPPYNYSWSNGAESRVNDSVYADILYLSVYDDHYCGLSDTFRVTQPEPLSETHVVRNVRGYGLSDGAIDITVDGGTKPYEYRWDTARILVDSLEDIYNLPANDYRISITDDHYCNLESLITVNQPPPLKATLEVTDVNCNEGTDGSIDMTVSGGVPPYSYIWANSEIILNKTTQDIDGLKKDYYYVIITDANDITLEKETSVEEPTSIKANIEPFDALCYDSADGYSLLTVSGGVEPYTYLWSNGSDKKNLRNVKAEKYSVLIVDDNGCSLRAETLINQPEEIIIKESLTHVTCKDQDDGEIKLSVSGGIPPYSYSWSNSDTSMNVEDLPGGDFTVTVRDQHNCPMRKTMYINVPDYVCIQIPNAFTPNGDGINDTWEIKNFFLYPDLTVKVFNNQGVVLFSSQRYEQPWEGTYNGNELPSGTYYYIVNPRNGDKPFTGTVTIVR